MIRNLKRTMAGGVVGLLTIGAAMAQTVGEPVYSDSLAQGWDNWSWATVSTSSRNFVHGGSRAIQVKTTSGWSAIYLHHAALDTTVYQGITFWIHGGTTGGQRLQFQALRSGASQPAIVLPTLTTGWQKVTLTLQQMGVAGATDFDGFWLQDITGKAQSAYYLDDIQLDRAPIPTTIDISVDPAHPIKTISPNVFGLNTSIWDQYYDTAATPADLKAIGTTILRYPGGSISNLYHWKTNMTENSEWPWVNGFDTFAKTAKELGAQAIITTNYGSGTAEEAADWVRYSNITKGYGFKYWEVGNENYGDWEYDKQARPWDPIIYATRAADYITKMKAVDPTIKVGVVVTTDEDGWGHYSEQHVVNPRTGVDHAGWTALVLSKMAQLGVKPDFVINHKYDQLPGHENDSFLLKSTKTWQNDSQAIRQMLLDYFGTTAGATIDMVVTEHHTVTSNPGKQSVSLVSALYLCDSYGEMFKSGFNMLNWWDLRNGQLSYTNNSPSLYGWRQYGDYGLVTEKDDRYPSYYAMQLLRYFARGGDQVLPVTTSYPTLAAHAMKKPDGTTTLMVINKSPNTTLTGQIAVPGTPTLAAAPVYTYGIVQDNAAKNNNFNNEQIVRTSTAAGANFTYAFPPYSVTVIQLTPTPVFDPPAPKAPTNLVANTLNPYLVKIVWQDNSTDEDGFRIEVSRDQTTWTQLRTVRANVKELTIDGLTANSTYYYRVRSISGNGRSKPSNVVQFQTPTG